VPMNDNEIKVLLIDPLASNIKSHLFDDDLFLAECIFVLVDEILVVSSSASIENIRRELNIPTRENTISGRYTRFVRLNLLQIAYRLPCSRFGDVIFQSFEEVSVLLFMLLHPRKRVHLIVTNNLRSDRLKRHPILGRFFLRATLQYAASVIVHSQHEVNIIKELLPAIDTAKLFIKPFHQLAFCRVQLSWKEKSRTILFVGPESSHKKIEPVVNLIKSDKNRHYRYVFCAMHDDMEPHTRSFLEAQDNVELLFCYVATDEYYRLISDSAFIILTHDQDFEGTLSGVFCDAIASNTSVIARDMSPHNEFFKQFGAMGFLVDYRNPAWCEQVLRCDLEIKYDEFQRNMALCREASSMDSIRNVFKSILYQDNIEKQT